MRRGPTKGSSTSSSSKGRTRPSAIEVRCRRPRLNRAGQVVGAVAEAEAIEQLVEIGHVDRHPVEGGHVGEVLAHGEVVVEDRGIREVAHRRASRRRPGRLTEHGDLAVAELEEPGGHGEEGRLAGAVVADQRHRLAPRHPERERVERDEIGVGLGRLVGGEDRRGGFSLRHGPAPSAAGRRPPMSSCDADPAAHPHEQRQDREPARHHRRPPRVTAVDRPPGEQHRQRAQDREGRRPRRPERQAHALRLGWREDQLPPVEAGPDRTLTRAPATAPSARGTAATAAMSTGTSPPPGTAATVIATAATSAWPSRPIGTCRRWMVPASSGDPSRRLGWSTSWASASVVSSPATNRARPASKHQRRRARPRTPQRVVGSSAPRGGVGPPGRPATGAGRGRPRMNNGRPAVAPHRQTNTQGRPPVELHGEAGGGGRGRCAGPASVAAKRICPTSRERRSAGLEGRAGPSRATPTATSPTPTSGVRKRPSGDHSRGHSASSPKGAVGLTR